MKVTDVTNPNSGQTYDKIGKGQTIVRAYGQDKSSMSGAATDERIGTFGGGKDDLSHSIGGSKLAKAPSR